MNIRQLRDTIKAGNIEWQRHALERMMERGISREMVKRVLLSGEIIEDYSEGTPYPSALLLGSTHGNPLHVVAALDSESRRCFIITAYRPDLEHFKADYKTRRSHGQKETL